MAFQHTNRRGVTYHLHRRERNGKTRYVFTRKPGEGALDAIPDGYEVRESVNGQVSLAKSTPRWITTAEEATIRRVLPVACRLEIKGRQIIVFEPVNGASSLQAGRTRSRPEPSPSSCRPLSPTSASRASSTFTEIG